MAKEQPPKRLTKTERSQLALEEKRKRNEAEALAERKATYTRRAVLAVSTVATVGTAAYLLRNMLRVLGASQSTPPPLTPREAPQSKAQPTRTSRVAELVVTSESSDTIIAREVARMGITENPEESAILAKYHFEPANPPRPLNQQTRELVKARVLNTTNFLGDSKNPVFNRAHRILNRISADPNRPRIRFGIFDTISSGLGDSASPLSFTYASEGNELIFPVEVSAFDVVNKINTVQLGIALVYFAEYANSLDEVSQRNASLPAARRVEIINREFDKKDVAFGQDALAQAQMAEAYLWENGLLGGQRRRGDSDEARVLKYIQTGSRPGNKEWIDYVGRELTSMEDTRPHVAKTPTPNRIYQYPLFTK